MKEKETGTLQVPMAAPLRRTAQLTGISESTVSRVIRQTAPTCRKTRADKFQPDSFDDCVIRRTVSDMISTMKVLPTTTTILKVLREKIDYRCGEGHLRQDLLRIGFKWRTVASNRKLLIEKPSIVNLRVQFLRKMKEVREAGRHIIYTDETYVHAGHAAAKCWQADDVQYHVPYNKGERLIIVHAGGQHGFVNGARLIFRSKTKSGDYHDEMNFNNFKRWLEEKLIPNLSANSVVVLDNAPYHNKQEERCPTQATRKDDMKEWLRRQGIGFRDDMLKVYMYMYL